MGCISGSLSLEVADRSDPIFNLPYSIQGYVPVGTVELMKN
jgi:hypothetical protein